ncbi:MAG TPA: GspMb/PilO family protein [Candidatus Limnocylindrales bacterium]|jgi:type II secretion system (T2SS) protein M|nr:GspMb/PilO family protein [Candidatus Limnocylindrales bacterium]
MNDFKIKKRLILGGLALLVAVDGGLAYHNARLAEKDQNPEVKLKAEARQVALVKADVDRANKIKARLPEVQKYFDQFESTLPPAGKGYSVVSQEVGEIAHDTHVQVQDLKFREKEISGRNVNEIDIEALLDGDYAGIVKFLNRLQRSKNTYVVDSLGLDSASGAGGPGQGAPGAVKVTLHLRSYFRKT